MIEIIAASARDAEAFPQTLLGRSLQRLRFDRRLVPRLTLTNGTGLSEIYNRAIETDTDSDILVFIHDDVWIEDYYFADRIIAGLAQFDIIGVAGNTRLSPNHLTWRANPGTGELDLPYLSGAIAHQGNDPFDNAISHFGPTPQACELLDGVLLAARRSTLRAKGVRFDPQFTFHFYDLDFCRAARQRGLTLGTWPIAITHQSKGAFNSPEWREACALYQRKWSTSTTAPGEEVARLAQEAGELRRQGQTEAALSRYRQALALDETLPELWFNYGNLLQSLSRYPDAETAFRRSIALKPDFYPGHLNLANVLRNQGQKEAAIPHYRQALQLNPGLSLGYRNLGRVLLDLKRPAEALELFMVWARLEPRQPAPLNGVGIARQALGQRDLAHMAFQQALSLNPKDEDTLNNLGNLLRLMNRSQEALTYLRQALALNPDDEVTLGNLIQQWLALGNISEALQTSEALLAKHPQSATGHLFRGYALALQARIAEAREAFENCWQQDTNAVNAVANALFGLLYQDWEDPGALERELRHWAARLPRPALTFAFQSRNRDPHRPLKVGYLSADFRSHSVAFFLEPILRRHHPDQVEVIGYHNAEETDDVTRRLQSLFPRWRPCYALSDEALARQIYEDGVDILVDLSGYTNGHRAGVIACKPAPVQILYIGYPGTTGQPAMDYLISDEVVTPPEYESLYTEKILRVEGSLWCFQPHDDAPDPGPLPALENGFITFGSFNHSPKFSATTLRLWGDVLKAVPQSRLLIKNLACADPQTQAYFRQILIANGAKPEQILFEPPTPDLVEFLAAYQRVDISLDTFPYNGGTTTCQSLLMGAPVVTLRGQNFFSRMSHGFLTHLGLGELSAAHPEEYAAIAQSLARDLDRLHRLRNSLRQRLLQSPVCDAEGATRALETAYRRAWRQYAGV